MNPALTVTSRTTAFQFRDESLPAGEIGARLNVRHLVEGSINRDGDALRVTAQLVDTRTDTIIWSDNFDESLGEVFAIQDRIAEQIAATLEVSVLGDQATARRTDPEAYALYLKGRYLARQGQQSAFEEAIDILDEALAIDSRYAPAWALKADIYNNLAGQGFWDWDRGFEAARGAAKNAVAADDGYAGGHAELAWVAHRYDGDLRAAFAHMQRALDINAFDTDILPGAAVLLMQAGQLDTAIDVLGYCVRRAPTDPRLRYNLGVAYKLRRPARARRSRVSQGSRNQSGLQRRQVSAGRNAVTHRQSGGRSRHLRHAGGLQPAERPGSRPPRPGRCRSLGERACRADRILGRKVARCRRRCLCLPGEPDAAFEWLEKDFEQYGAAGWAKSACSAGTTTCATTRAGRRCASVPVSRTRTLPASR